MSSLANTSWNINIQGTGGVLTFGASIAPPGQSGGNGNLLIQGDPTPFVWIEDGYDFMIQLQNQNPGYSTLTTYNGNHRGGSGNGWFSNFLVNFCTTPFSMTVNNG